ncbi:hypothetical protein [Clostridium estertheticum]|uniref:hypothetical protein n=1 Tax=Clostridium estertheticum TaxID=238834 RepID=UPI0035CCFD89
MEKVLSEQKSGDIYRTFTADFESTVPSEYTKNGKVDLFFVIKFNCIKHKKYLLPDGKGFFKMDFKQ